MKQNLRRSGAAFALAAVVVLSAWAPFARYGVEPSDRLAERGIYFRLAANEAGPVRISIDEREVGVLTKTQIDFTTEVPIGPRKIAYRYPQGEFESLVDVEGADYPLALEAPAFAELPPSPPPPQSTPFSAGAALGLGGGLLVLAGLVRARRRRDSRSAVPAIPDDPPPESGFARAIVVGVDYLNVSDSGDVAGPSVMDRDAKKMARALVETCGYPADCVELLTGADATADRFRTAIDQLEAVCHPGHTVFIYFSVHAETASDLHDETICLKTARYDPRHGAETGIGGRDLAERINKLEANRVIVVLDCCRAGGVVDLARLTSLSPRIGRVIMASSLPEQASVIAGGMSNSLFTHYLLEAIKRFGREARVVDVFDAAVDGMRPHDFDQDPVLVTNGMRENFPVGNLAPSARRRRTASPSSFTLKSGAATHADSGSYPLAEIEWRRPTAASVPPTDLAAAKASWPRGTLAREATKARLAMLLSILDAIVAADEAAAGAANSVRLLENQLNSECDLAALHADYLELLSSFSVGIELEKLALLASFSRKLTAHIRIRNAEAGLDDEFRGRNIRRALSAFNHLDAAIEELAGRTNGPTGAALPKSSQ
jgi:hypothetical protein